jgi:hypothetical protein
MLAKTWLVLRCMVSGSAIVGNHAVKAVEAVRTVGVDSAGTVRMVDVAAEFANSYEAGHYIIYSDRLQF